MKPIFAAAAILLTATPVLAQDRLSDRPSIIVVGEGEAEQAPDTFRVMADVEGRGATQVDALRHLAGTLDRLGADLQRLEGLQTARLSTGLPQVEPTHAADCNSQRYGGDQDNCPVTGYRAAMSVTLEGAPIARAGDAVSLAAERGARNARLESVYLASDRGLQAEANQAAFADARRQADALAQASGQRVVRILRIQDPGARNYESSATQIDEVVVTGSRIRPSVSLNVAPPPVHVTSRLTVVFEIE